MGLTERPREDHTHMRTDLSHLPEAKQRELAEIVQIVRATVVPELVILYGSYARGDWKEEKDLAPQRWSGHPSDYDILVIVGDETAESDDALTHRLQEELGQRQFSAHVRPIVHRLGHVNRSLEESRYFFVDIKRDGRLLYAASRPELAEPIELSPADAQRIAREYFDHWFYRAQQFYKVHDFLSAEGDLRGAAFNLNQAAEAAYKTILLVFEHYCPHEHLLRLLGRWAEHHGPVYKAIFPRGTDQERDYFRLLDNAYIGARYHLEFPVTRADLDYLAPRVKQLLDVTESLCRRQIEALGLSD